MRLRSHASLIVSGLMMVLAGYLAINSANTASANVVGILNWTPSQGYVQGRESYYYPGYRDINSWMIWSSSGDPCSSSSRIYAFCSTAPQQHRVFEHEVWLYNYQESYNYPYSYAWANVLQGYSTSLPGGVYLDTRDSDPSGELSFTVGTVDAWSIQTNNWYYANILTDPYYPGPNWFALRFQYGNVDQPGCGVWVSLPWCMLYPHDGYERIAYASRYTVPVEWFEWTGP